MGGHKQTGLERRIEEAKENKGKLSSSSVLRLWYKILHDDRCAKQSDKCRNHLPLMNCLMNYYQNKKFLIDEENVALFEEKYKDNSEIEIFNRFYDYVRSKRGKFPGANCERHIIKYLKKMI